jgi:hypothetical protein
VAGLGAGVYFGLQAKSLSNELSEEGAVYDPAKVADGEAADRNLLIATAVGGVLVVGGVVLYMVGKKQGARDGVALTPVVSPDGAGLVLSGVLR